MKTTLVFGKLLFQCRSGNDQVTDTLADFNINIAVTSRHLYSLLPECELSVFFENNGSLFLDSCKLSFQSLSHRHSCCG